MNTLIFSGTILILIIQFLKMIRFLIQGKPVIPVIRSISLVVLSYFLIWCVCYFTRRIRSVPFGTDICFDDWCATITQAERKASIGYNEAISFPKGEYLLLHVRMTNKARGIAQKPSEPRVFLLDASGNKWLPSDKGQKALEGLTGKQPPLDQRLELHESLETLLVFDIPKNTKGLNAGIGEGPFITKLLFPGNKNVFSIP